MSDLGWARVGLIKASDDPWTTWADEILDYSGLPYEHLTDFSNLASVDVLLLFGYGRLSPHENLAIRKWIELGGRLIACGSTWGLDDAFGVKDLGQPHYSKSKLLRPGYNDRMWPEGSRSAVFFGGTRVAPCNARTASRTDCGNPALTRHGRCVFIAPHLGQSIAMLSMGRSVETDGIGPGDATVVLEDGERRSEDGTVLCYTTDRSVPEGCSIPIFASPHADVLREILYRALYEAVEGTGKKAYAIWRWPSNAHAVASVSVDCDSDDSDRVMQVHRSLEDLGQKASWLVPPPGFSSDVYRRMKDWGDSIGLLYHLSDSEKAQETIKRDSLLITRAAGLTNLSVLRPLAGAWRGLKSPYLLADQIGAGLSVAKGGFQPGSSGFTFGTSFLFNPVYPGGKRSNVAELPYAICRPGVVTETSAIQSIIDTASQVNGCVHTSLALSCAHEQDAGLTDLLRRTREAKLGHYSPEELMQYERARRSITVERTPGDLKFTSNLDVKGLTLMIIGGGHEAITCNRRYPSVSVRRHGTLVSTFVISLEAKTPSSMRFEKTLVA